MKAVVCKQDVNSTLCQTSEEVEDDTHDVRPRTPIRNKARSYEDGNPSSIQPQENSDPQFNKEQLLTGNMIPRESGHERTISSPSDDNETSRQRIKLSTNVSKVEEELVESPTENLKLVESYKQNYEEEFRLKDEELRNLITEKKQNEDKFEVTIKRFEKQIRNLQTKSDEDLKKTKDENARLEEDLKKTKDENARLEEDLKKTKDENARLEEDLKKTKDENARLEEDLKKTKDENARLEEDLKKTKDENARLEEDLKKTKDENARLEEEGREEYEEGNEMVKTQMKITEELEDENKRLKEELVIFKICKICLNNEKDIVILPCGHFGVCQNCYEENYQDTDPCPFCRQIIENHVKVYNQ